MSDIVLATRYAAENYPAGLENLAKRYRQNDNEEAIHYSELGFGGISDDQAKSVLRFFADIELLENPKGANYNPPDSLLDWQLKMGDTAEQGKEQVRDQLLEYNVFSELNFILEDGDENLHELAEQVGGIVGIDEDELSDMEKTIEVFAECGFLKIGEDEVVSLVDDVSTQTTDKVSRNSTLDDSTPSDMEKTDQSEPTKENKETLNQPTQNQLPEINTRTQALTADLNISVDVTEMEPEDIREKLQIIEETIGNDGE